MQKIQLEILGTYQNDFGRYEGIAPVSHLKVSYNMMPKMIRQKIRYNKIDTELRSSDLKQVLSVLMVSKLPQLLKWI